MGSFGVLVFGVLIGGSKKDQFLGSVGHGIRLWFALTGVIVDCRFLRPRRAIEMIEVIEMIEMIEVIWGGRLAGVVRFGWLRWGSSWSYLELWTFGLWLRIWVFPMVWGVRENRKSAFSGRDTHFNF